MKKNQALAYIRQLCCLGLESAAMAPELLRAIRDVIPSNANMFVEFGQDHYPRCVTPEFVIPEALAIFAENARWLFPTEKMATIMRKHDSRSIIDTYADVWDDFYSSDLYNLCFRPYEQHHLLQLLIRRDGAPASGLVLYRPRSQPPFTAADKNQLQYLLPYISHGRRSGGGTDVGYVRAESSMFIMGGSGQLLFASETARRLLWLSRHPSSPVGLGKPVPAISVPPALERLCRHLEGIFQGRDAPPPSLTHVNACGRFVFRADWLDPVNREPGGLIGVTVEHQKPAVLRLLNGIKDLPLSPAQREVCLLLAQNHSQESIARLLHIKPTTAKDHVRKIYRKLDIHQREELVSRLSGQAEACLL